MEKVSTTFNKFTNLIDRDIKGVHIGCYSVALIGLTIAIRKVRPFSKFKTPKDVPNHFIKEKRELVGVVQRIDPNGGVLMVRHKPLVNVPLIQSGELPVKISGVKVSGLGLSWLQSIVVGRQINFIPVNKNKNALQCQVLLVEVTKNKKIQHLNVGETLVKIGFGHMEHVFPSLRQEPFFRNYYQRLKSAENFALRKKLGLKYYIKPTKNILKNIVEYLNTLTFKLGKFANKKLKNLTNITTA